MKRQELLRHLQRHGCVFEGEGAKHFTVFNPTNQRVTRVPRHREIKPGLVRAICKQLDIPAPFEK